MKLFAIVLIGFLLSACSTLPALPSPWAFFGKSDLASVKISALTDANDDMATAVDLVLVSDKQLAKELPKNSLVWFEQKETWLDNNPTAITSMLIEVPPKKDIEEIKIPWNLWGYYQVSAYLKYFDKGGQNKLDLTDFEDAYITLSDKKVEFGEVEDSWSFFLWKLLKN